MTTNALYMAIYFCGMGMQAAISAALFPEGIDPMQQAYAALIFGAVAMIYVAIAVILKRRRA